MIARGESGQEHANKGRTIHLCKDAVMFGVSESCTDGFT